MRNLSPEFLRAMFAPETDEALAILITITGSGLAEPVRLASNFTQRLSEDDTNIIYGLISRGNPYTFIPMEPVLPGEDDGVERASITLHDVTDEVLPILRQMTDAPSVLMEVILVANPDQIEASFSGLYIGSIPYDATTVSIELTSDSHANEPFPAHCFVPSIFPGLF